MQLSIETAANELTNNAKDFIIKSKETNEDNSYNNAVTIKKNSLNNSIYVNSSGVGIGTSSPKVKLYINSTDAIRIPAGKMRNQVDDDGYIRYNTDNNEFEGYGNGAWGSLVELKTQMVQLLLMLQVIINY